jgi:hypothetical protein
VPDTNRLHFGETRVLLLLTELYVVASQCYWEGVVVDFRARKVVRMGHTNALPELCKLDYLGDRA